MEDVTSNQTHTRQTRDPPRTHRYYLSGNDAFRLKLQLPLTQAAHDRRKRDRDAILGYAEEMDHQQQGEGEQGDEEEERQRLLDGLPEGAEIA